MTPKTAPCPSCGEPVLWAIARMTGMATPLDPQPDPDANPGKLVVVDTGTGLADLVGLEAKGTSYVFHAWTCAGFADEAAWTKANQQTAREKGAQA